MVAQVRIHFRARDAGDAERPDAVGMQAGVAGGEVGDDHAGLAADRGGDGRRAAAIRDAADVDAGHRLEQFERKQRRRAARGVRELAGLLLGERDQLGNRVRRHVDVDHQGLGDRNHQAERLEILLRVVGQVGKHQRIDRHGAVVRDQERVAVGRSLLHGFRADPHRGARAVLDHDGLAPLRLQLFADDARAQVDGAARRRRHDDLYRVVGKILRVGDAQCRRRERTAIASARCMKMATSILPRRFQPAALMACRCSSSTAGISAGGNAAEAAIGRERRNPAGICAPARCAP